MAYSLQAGEGLGYDRVAAMTSLINLGADQHHDRAMELSMISCSGHQRWSRDPSVPRRASNLATLAIIAGAALVFTGAFASFFVRTVLDGSSPTMTDRMVRDGVPSTCAAVKSYPGELGSTSVYRYKVLAGTYPDPSGCATFKIVAGGTCAHISIYSPTFDPANRAANYLGDTGNSGNGRELSVRLARDQKFAIVLTDLTTTAADCVVDVYGRITPAAHDFDGTGTSDIVWRQTGSGSVALWMINGGTLAQAASIGTVPSNWSIVGQRDFNGDGKDDLLWRDATSGTVAIWFLDGPTVASTGVIGSVPNHWSVVGVHDFNSDSKGDLLWRDSSGNIAIWLMNGAQVVQAALVGQVPMDWSVAAVADFDGDGNADILWRNLTTGQVAIWFMNGVTVTSTASVATVSTSWSIVGSGDFHATGWGSIVWRDTSGNVAIWQLTGPRINGTLSLGTVPLHWVIVESGDFNADGAADLLWRDTNSGMVAIWYIDFGGVSSTTTLGTVPSDWVIQNLNVN
jgi:hypothetical protein